MKYKISYRKDPSIVPVYVTGMFGAVTAGPDGANLNMSFFVDMPGLPGDINLDIDEKTGKASEKNEPIALNQLREVVFSGVMTKNTTLAFRDWLNVKLKEFDEANSLLIS